MTDDLRFPIGPFVSSPAPLDAAERRRAIEAVSQAPAALRAAVRDLADEQLDTPYRPGGWTVRQVVHHLPDSHVNAYTRLKLALTENRPTIRTYEEARWAELPDSGAPIDLSLDLLDFLHRRWTYLWERLPDDAWGRPFDHPDLGAIRVDQLLALYAWHGQHHVAHITTLRKRKGW